jgi:hypothetical protein
MMILMEQCNYEYLEHFSLFIEYNKYPECALTEDLMSYEAMSNLHAKYLTKENAKEFRRLKSLTLDGVTLSHSLLMYLFMCTPVLKELVARLIVISTREMDILINKSILFPKYERKEVYYGYETCMNIDTYCAMESLKSAKHFPRLKEYLEGGGIFTRNVPYDYHCLIKYSHFYVVQNKP